MGKRRIIENNDFRSPLAHDQAQFGFPANAEEWAGLIERVRGTGITSYVIDSIEYDNKVYFETKLGIDWAKIDFAGHGTSQDAGYENWDKSYGAAGRLMQKMRAAGREPLQVVIDSCRDMDIEVFAGIRMNDCHDLEPLSHESPDVSFYLKEHPEQAFCFPGTNERTRLADFANKDLRDYRFSIMAELMEQFDFDGMELNWMRAPYLFQPDECVGCYGYINEERFDELAPIMTEWTAEIRSFLDDLGKKRGKEMVLGVRVPETPEITRAVGIDLPEWIRKARLDYIVPTGYHSIHFNIPVERFKAMCQGTECAVYPSMFPNVGHGAKIIRTGQTSVYAAAAQTYYASGADGVELFNHFHPACKCVGMDFNSEVFDVVASQEALDDYPVHHYYIVYSAQPGDLADEAVKMSVTGFRGTLLQIHHRRPFEFRFGEDLATSKRQLTRLRFKIFDMTPDDPTPDVWINDAPVKCQTEWRQRLTHQNAIVFPGEEIGTQGRGWGSTKDIELLAGEPIPPSDKQVVTDLLAEFTWNRPEWASIRKGQGDGKGRDIFMLVEADVTSIPPAALRRGSNRLYVQINRRRDNYATDLFMGELEIITENKQV